MQCCSSSSFHHYYNAIIHSVTLYSVLCSSNRPNMKKLRENRVSERQNEGRRKGARKLNLQERPPAAGRPSSPAIYVVSYFLRSLIHTYMLMYIAYEDVYLLLHFRFWHFQEWYFQKCHFQLFSEIIIWIILTLLEKILILTLSRMTLYKVTHLKV